MKKKIAKSGFNLYRFSMGWDWMTYRPEYEWFTLDSIVSGTNEGWNQLIAKNPSLEKVVVHATSEYQKYVDKFVTRYRADPEQVKEFYNMYIGYHPAYGAYMVGVGPYVGMKPEDEENKFGYFTMRYASTDSRNLVTLWNKCLQGHSSYKEIAQHLNVNHLNSILDPDDFMMQVRHETGERGGRYELIDITPEFLEENNYQKATSEGREVPYRTVLGVGSYFFIKPKGVFKILMNLAAKDGQDEQLKNTILQVAQRRGIPEDQISEAAQNDTEFTKEIVDLFSQINPLADGIMDSRRAGSQRTEALKPSREQTQMLKLMKEICETIVETNSQDPEVIANAMNSKRPKKKGKAQGVFTPQIITHWLEQIKFFSQDHDADGNVISEKSHADMINEFSENMVEMRSGFEDMETALKIAALRFAEVQSAEVDPVTRAKLVMIPSLFEMPTNVNLTSVDLTQMRSGEGIQPVLQEDVVEETQDIQPTDEEVDITEVERPSVKTPPQAVEEEEEEEVLARTLRSLNKVAHDLRSNKNGKIAWGIERVVKKYQRKD